MKIIQKDKCITKRKRNRRGKTNNMSNEDTKTKIYKQWWIQNTWTHHTLIRYKPKSIKTKKEINNKDIHTTEQDK